MKALLLSLLTALLTAAPGLALTTTPFKNLDLWIVTWPNNGLLRGSPKYWIELHVSIHPESGKPVSRIMAYYTEIGMHHPLKAIHGHARLNNIQTEGVHLGLIGPDDIKALKSVVTAATKDEVLTEEVKMKGPLLGGIKQKLATRYSSAKENGQWKVIIGCGKLQTRLTLEEALHLMEVYGETEKAAQWYQRLLTADVPPVPNETSHPPAGTVRQLYIDLGDLQNDIFHYKVAASTFGKEAVQHTISINDTAGNFFSASGMWVRDMMFKTVEGNMAAQNKDGFSFIAKHGDVRYEVTADPNDGTAELRIHPWFGRSNLFRLQADYHREAAEELKAMIQHSDEVGEWLKQHGDLLFPRKPNPDELRIR